MQRCGLQSVTGLRRSLKTCRMSNALDGSEHNNNEMPEVADGDKEDEFKSDCKEDN